MEFQPIIPVLISPIQELGLQDEWEKVKESVFETNTRELVKIIVKNLVKVAEEKDLYEKMLNAIKDSNGKQELLVVDIYKFNSITMLTTDINKEFETKCGRIVNLFAKYPVNLICDENGEEYSLDGLFSTFPIAALLSAHLGENMWVTVENSLVEMREGFNVMENSITVHYFPDGLTSSMKYILSNALHKYDMMKDSDSYSDLPPLIPVDECSIIEDKSCTASCYCSY